MRYAACALIFSNALLNAALASKPTPVTILVDFESSHSDISLPVLKGELQHLLEPLGLSIDVQVKSEVPDATEFAEVVVFKMKGSCSMKPLPMAALSDERGPLAMAYSSDGTILHFGEVECNRVRRCLSRVLGNVNSKRNQSYLSAAIGAVMAHEMYHMMSNSKAHTKLGLTKQGLSAEELLDPDLSLPQLAREALRHGFAR